MDIVSHCPLLVTTRPYRTVRGGRFVLVVCKGTFLLTPTTATLGGTQEPIHEDDKRWDDKPDRSVFAPNDIVPFKRDVDVVLVGHAFAPGGQAARSIMTRLCVGDIDKSIEVFGDRLFTPHGELRDGPRITRARLRYERAAGGPGTNNPVGMRHDKKDLFGAISMASLQPPGLHVTRPEDLAEPIGYGPIAPEWPMRMSRLGHLGKSFSSSRWFDAPFPDDLDPSFFNVAPPDQRLREVRPDERIVLEGLTAEQARFVTQLPGLTPHAVVERVTGRCDPLQLRADTLWIDTSRRVCTVTWRANLAMTHASDTGRIVVTLGAPETSRVIARHDPALLAMPMPSGNAEGQTLSINLQGKNRPIMPFDPHAIAAPDTADFPDDPALIEDEITFVQHDEVKSNTLPFVAAQNAAADRNANVSPPPALDKALPFAAPPRASSSPGLPFVAAPAPVPPAPVLPAPPPVAPPPVPSRDLPFFTPAGPSNQSGSSVFRPPPSTPPPPVFPAPPPVPVAPSAPPAPASNSGIFRPSGAPPVFPAPPPLPPASSAPPPVFPAPPPIATAPSAPPPSVSNSNIFRPPGVPPPVFPAQPPVAPAPSAPPPHVFPAPPPVATAASFTAIAATSGYPTLGKPVSAPPPPPVPFEAAPEAPPMIGPLATPEMLGRSSVATTNAGAVSSEERSTPTATTQPTIEEDSVERCARITASIARRKDDRTRILEAEKLDAKRFTEMQTRWNAAISAETDRGKTILLQKFDDAYVERLEQERGVILPEEFARLVVAGERGHPDATLRELGLPSSALMRIERVFLRRTARDLDLAQRVLKAIEAERDA